MLTYGVLRVILIRSNHVHLKLLLEPPIFSSTTPVHQTLTSSRTSADAAYTFAESLGVRFELSGETLPDPTAPSGLPLRGYANMPLPETVLFAPQPMFDYRGLQPFHDFPEGS